MSQNKFGHILGHVKDLGGDYSDANTRGYMTNDEMRFRTDACDYVGLLCLQTSKSGGESRDRELGDGLQQDPRDAPRPRQDAAPSLSTARAAAKSAKGELPYFAQPIVSFTDGYFSAIGLTRRSKGAEAPACRNSHGAERGVRALPQAIDEHALDIDFQRGDIQFLDNFVMLHTRRCLRDWLGTMRRKRDCCGCGCTIRRPADLEGAGRGPRRRGVKSRRQRIARIEAEAA